VEVKTIHFLSELDYLSLTQQRNEKKFLEIIDVLKLLTDYSFAVTALIGLNQVGKGVNERFAS
jgi:hypothetical protein